MRSGKGLERTCEKKYLGHVNREHDRFGFRAITGKRVGWRGAHLNTEALVGEGIFGVVFQRTPCEGVTR